MNGVGRLGQLYGLSPATMTGLANIQGVPAPPAPAPVDAPPEGDYGYGNPYSDPAMKPGGAPAPGGGVIRANGKDYRIGAVDDGGYLVTENTTPEDIIKRTGQGAQPAQIQGPAVDSFPTVKSAEPAAAMGHAPSASPSYTIPAHWQAGGHSVSSQRSMLDPNAMEEADYNRSVSDGQRLIAGDKRLEAAQQAGLADAVQASAHAMIAKQTQDKIATIDAKRDAFVAGRMRKLEELSAATQRQINPDQLFQEKGTAARVGAALMIGLGQFASMASGRGSNAALQIVNDAIDRNIAAQKEDINNAHRRLSNEQNIYAQNLAAFGDERQAVLATKAMYLDAVSAMADVQKAKAGLTQADAANHEMLGGLFAQRAEQAKELAKMSAVHFNENSTEHFVPAQHVGGAVGDKGKEALFVPTLGGYARDEKAASELNKKGALRMQIGENMRQINGLLEEAKGLSSATSPLRLRQIDEQIQQLTDDALTKNTVLEGQGAMSASDKEVAAQAKGLKDLKVTWTPDAIISRRQENLKKAALGVLEQHRLEGESYGVQRGTEQYVQGPNGPVAVRRLQGRNAMPSKNTQAVDDLVQPPKGESGR